MGAHRVDFLGVRIGPDDVVVHWVPGWLTARPCLLLGPQLNLADPAIRTEGLAKRFGSTTAWMSSTRSIGAIPACSAPMVRGRRPSSISPRPTRTDAERIPLLDQQILGGWSSDEKIGAIIEEPASIRRSPAGSTFRWRLTGSASASERIDEFRSNSSVFRADRGTQGRLSTPVDAAGTRPGGVPDRGSPASPLDEPHDGSRRGADGVQGTSP